MKTKVNTQALVEALKCRLSELATVKMNKYVLKEDAMFDQRLNDVVITLVALIAKRDSHTISVNGETFNKDEYKVTESMQKLIDAGKIYANVHDANLVDPWFEVEAVSATLTPGKFNAFWSDINSYLNEPITFTQIQVSPNLSVNDLEALVTEDGRLARMGGTVICDYVVQFLGIQNPCFAANQVRTYDLYNERGLGTWLLK